MAYIEHFQSVPDYVANYPDLRAFLDTEVLRAPHGIATRPRSIAAKSAISMRNALVSMSNDDLPAAKRFRSDSSFKTASLANYPWAQNMGRRAAEAMARPASNPASDYLTWVTALPRVIPRQAVRPMQFIEETPSLDSQTLVSLGVGKPPGIYGFALSWYTHIGDLNFSGLFGCGGRDAEWVYIQKDEPTGIVNGQAIQMKVNGSGKRVFVCPVTQKLCAQLYYRDGWFASAKAQRLVHASQRKHELNRAPNL